MTRMISSSPARKVVAGSLASAIATVGVWALEHYGAVVLPEPVKAAVVVIVTLVAGYMVPPAERDQIIADESQPS